MRPSGNYRHSAFTLLEVMLVLLILAMMAGFAVPYLVEQKRIADQRCTKAMIGPSGTLSTAIDNFYLNLGRYPEELVDLARRPDWVGEDDSRWVKFVKDPNFEDAWGQEIVYEAPGEYNPEDYDLISIGPDGLHGTSDDLTNASRLQAG